MPNYKHQCSTCGESGDELYPLRLFDENASMECPACKEKTYNRVMAFEGGFQIVGYCYDNEYGKKAWKRNLSVAQQAEVVAGTRAPY